MLAYASRHVQGKLIKKIQCLGDGKAEIDHNLDILKENKNKKVWVAIDLWSSNNKKINLGRTNKKIKKYLELK